MWANAYPECIVYGHKVYVQTTRLGAADHLRSTCSAIVFRLHMVLSSRLLQPKSCSATFPGQQGDVDLVNASNGYPPAPESHATFARA
jgi:hypothetical protein